MLKFIAFVFILPCYAKYRNQNKLYCVSTKGPAYEVLAVKEGNFSLIEILLKNRPQSHLLFEYTIVTKKIKDRVYYNVTMYYLAQYCLAGISCHFSDPGREKSPAKNVPTDYIKELHMTVFQKNVLKIGDTITLICKGIFAKKHHVKLRGYIISIKRSNRLYAKNLEEWTQYGCKIVKQEIRRNITITSKLHNKNLICDIRHLFFSWVTSKREKHTISINHFGASYRMNNITGPTNVAWCNKIRLNCSCVFENKQYPKAGASLISLTWLERGKPVAETSNIDKKGHHLTSVHDNFMGVTYKEVGNIAWSELIIKRPLPCYTYNFTCRIEAWGPTKNPLVFNRSHTVKVQDKSQQPPYMYVPQKTYYEGHNFTITCSARSDCLSGYLKLFILRNNALDERLKNTKTDLHRNCSQSVSILYTFLDRDHLSRFRCDFIAWNFTGSITSKLLTVESLVKKAQILIDNNIVIKTAYEIVEGREYNIICQANSYPEPLYKWAYKSDIMDEKVFISRSKQISRQFKKADKGAYWCEATNTLGDGRSSTVRSTTVHFDIIDPVPLTQGFEEQDSPTIFWIVYLVILIIVYCFIVGAFIHHYDPAHRAPRRQRQHMD